MLLAGDIGGTSTRLALVRVDGPRLSVVAREKYPSHEHAGLDEIVRAFTAKQQQHVEHACFGIAGPIRDGRVHTPNLPWVVDAAALAAALKISDVHLINDLEANAHGIPALSPEDFVTLQPGQPDLAGNAAIISAGTGLGEAGIHFDGQQLRPLACEGGHVDFAPRNEVECALRSYLAQRFIEASEGHVSYERVLSGPGLVNIYQFLRDTGRGTETPEMAAAIRDGDPAAAISQAAANGSCEISVQAMEMFVSFYGAEAGNLALKMLSTRGMFLGGGIAPKIIDKLRTPTFLNAFRAKGRLRPLLSAMPVRVIMNDRTALLGAARYAAELAGLVPPWTQ